MKSKQNNEPFKNINVKQKTTKGPDTSDKVNIYLARKAIRNLPNKQETTTNVDTHISVTTTPSSIPPDEHKIHRNIKGFTEVVDKGQYLGEIPLKVKSFINLGLVDKKMDDRNLASVQSFRPAFKNTSILKRKKKVIPQHTNFSIEHIATNTGNVFSKNSFINLGGGLKTKRIFKRKVRKVVPQR
jgi:hypothetical protein